MRRLAPLLAALLAVSLLPAEAAFAARPKDRGFAFRTKALSRPIYGTKAPSADPDVQRHYVEAEDGIDLYVETWLPAPKNGRKPPKKVPTILIMTPYVVQGSKRYAPPSQPDVIRYWTSRGYAVAQHHVRGTGESGGCLEQTARDQIDDGALVVQYLGRDAPWSNGRVGMFGRSYDAETQISTAGFGDREKIKYLKALVPIASVGGQYDWNFMDGVNWTGQPAIGNASYFITSMEPGQTFQPGRFYERLECQDEVMLSSADVNGDYSEYWQRREYRPGAPRIKAPTFYVHGLRDFNVQPITLAGWFNDLPRTTPHKGLFGVFDHAFPSHRDDASPEWTRSDWLEMVTMWFDRYLKRLPAKVGKWPQVQVQSSNGQWWATREFPTTRGPIGQLALSRKGKLGVRRPKGVSKYIEQVEPGPADDTEQVVFVTKPLRRRLQITGQPVLDAWLKTSTDDGHVAVELEVLGKKGRALRHSGSWNEAVATYGVRSLQHRAPMRRGFFAQEEGKPAPTNKPIRTTIRFLPTDLYVPKGGQVRLTISGSVDYTKGTSDPSGKQSEITVLHSCKYPTALRFLMPKRRAKLLNVREPHEKGKLKSTPARVRRRTGGGLATKRVCGKKPRGNPFLTGRFK